MKLLKEEEFNNLALKGKGRSSPIFNSIVNLNVGEAVLIEKKDWNRKASPSTLVKYIEKTHALKFTCGELVNGQGWAVKRIDKPTQAEPKKQQVPIILKETVTPIKITSEELYTDEGQLKLKSEIVIFYLGRIASCKIEKIEDSLKAVMDQFWEQDRAILKKLFLEAIDVLSKSNHIIIENGKTYIPLKRN
ncbi:hypothetical protein [Sediminibacterium sp.]|uniref:hypothetical protein n=1 Tax=Sediminibacterium sp. TaxID=1917865 RepID=UPI002735A5B2|nr:hypothetical protein [Sediminibacterium sp.]MDP3567460.1 hypothetical protein [Sediminibacterium sp.]